MSDQERDGIHQVYFTQDTYEEYLPGPVERTGQVFIVRPQPVRNWRWWWSMWPEAHIHLNCMKLQLKFTIVVYAIRLKLMGIINSITCNIRYSVWAKESKVWRNQRNCIQETSILLLCYLRIYSILCLSPTD